MLHPLKNHHCVGSSLKPCIVYFWFTIIILLVQYRFQSSIQVAYRDDIWVKTLCVFLKCIRVCDNALLLLHVHVIVFICILI